MDSDFHYQNLPDLNSSLAQDIENSENSLNNQWKTISHGRPTPLHPTVDHVRDAYKKNNVEYSKKLHKLRRGNPGSSSTYHAEHHNDTSSEYLKATVFGGLDGIVTLFAIVAGCVGAHLSPTQTIIVGLCNLFADAVSMGFGEDFCISHMMAEELGILLDDDSPSPLQRGGVMFLAFNLFGMIPLAGYGLCYVVSTSWFPYRNALYPDIVAFLLTSLLSCVTLFILGAVKAAFINQSRIKAGMQVMINGIIAGFVAFSIGLFLQRCIGTNALT